MKKMGYFAEDNQIKTISLKEVVKVIQVDKVYRYPGIPEFILYENRIYPVIEKFSESGYCIILKNGRVILTPKIKGGGNDG